MTEKEIETIINQRKKRDDTLFYVDKIIEGGDKYVAVTNRRGLYGISLQCSLTEIILPTIFDGITLLSFGHIALINLEGWWGAFNYMKRKWLFMPLYKSVVPYPKYNTMEVVDKEDNHGLFSLSKDRMIIPPLYEDVTCWDKGEYLWVKQNGSYHFVRMTDGHFISTAEASMAFDTPTEMIVTYKKQIVSLTPEGYSDWRRLRDLVIRNKGRMSVQNLKYPSYSYTFDVYGYIFE